ncbi:MAG: periplasmic heavy metal sensor [Eubacteriales bacterium]|nr:periplasmic heavy metal sensor [Eubacteriales bacterium]MDD3845232.1 periplasmic heavy metal sensor [Syntrophorhabdaceae bacterium]
MKKVLGILVAVIFVAMATTVFAIGPAGFGGGPKGPGVDLSKEQTGKMWQLRETFNTETSSLRYELFQKRNDLRTLYADPKATDAAILAKEKEVDTLRQKMHDKMVRFKLDQRKVYTPEQLKKLAHTGYGPGRGGFGGGFGGGRGGFGGRGSGTCGRF